MNKTSILIAALFAAAGLAAPASAQELTGTLKKIRDSGKVVMGTRDSSAPLAFTLGGGQFTGYHVEMCDRILDTVKKQIGVPAAKTEYTLVTSQNRIPLVENGTVDIECGSTTNNAARQKQVAFGLTTYVTEVRMAVRANSGLTSINQLNGKNVATTTGTTSVQTLRKHERATGVDFKEIYGKDHADSFLLLESGRADAFVMDDNILAGNIGNSKNPKDFMITGEVLSVEPIAVMLRKDDPAFKKAVDDAIRGMMKSGELEKLYAKWFLSPTPPRNVNYNLQMGGLLKGLIASPNDRPMEDYAKK
jgi:glutamate/aspartate transport system substrate-binding protein